MVNPGGPGAPGTKTANDAESYFGDPLRESFDIVGFDPRGTGSSDPVDCLSDEELDAFIAADPAPDDPGEDEEFAQSLTDFFEGCVENSDDIVGHVSTNEAARDMDVLRAALGEEKLTYLGFSYGTRLGSTYAELFPEKVGKFVLDGATDPALTLRQSVLNQAGGFQVALESYIQDCVDGGDCFLGDTVQEGLDRISALLDQIDDQPLPTNEERDLQIGNAFYGLVLPLYSQENWPFLTQGLEQAFDGDGSTLLLLSDFYGSRENGEYADNSLEAIYAINCLDDPTSIEPGEVASNYKDFRRSRRPSPRCSPGACSTAAACRSSRRTRSWTSGPRAPHRSWSSAPLVTPRRRTPRPWRSRSSWTPGCSSAATATATRPTTRATTASMSPSRTT